MTITFKNYRFNVTPPMLVQLITFLLFTLIVGVMVFQSASAEQIYGGETLKRIGAGDTVILNGTKVLGPVMTGDTIICNDCKTNDLIAGQNVLMNGGKATKVMAGQTATISNAKVVGDVQAGQEVSITDAKVVGTVHNRGLLTLNKATVTGRVSTLADNLTVTNSNLGSIELRVSDSQHRNHSHFSSNNNTNFSTTNSFNNTSVHSTQIRGKQLVISGGSVVGGGPNGRPQVNVQGGGRSIFNDFTITTVPLGTQVITPEGYVYRNGMRVGDTGPENYYVYAEENPRTPVVNGPNWPNENALMHLETSETTSEVTEEAKTEEPVEPEKPVLQTLVLDGTIIQNGVFFESGAGEVVLKNGAQVYGAITGGKIAN